MKYLIYGDVHFCEYSSIIRSEGKKYSTRLENLIKSVSWAENLALEYDCDEIICLGDFFNAPDLNSREITALQEIVWAPIPHTFLVGNHDASNKSLKYNSIMALKNNGFKIISEPALTTISDINGLKQLLFLPYITENTDISLKDYPVNNKYPCIVLSHNDIKGIQYGIVESKHGFDVNEIDESGYLFLNGHIHNSSQFGKKAFNLGVLTGQNFKEDAFRYTHQLAILDTVDNTLDFIENPYAFNFYNIAVNTVSDLIQLREIKDNAVLSIKCNEDLKDMLMKYLSETDSKIVAKRVMITRNIKGVSNNNLEDLQNYATNYLVEFSLFCKNIIGTSEILDYELSEVCK
ncbi:MAG: metallophosphoesterase [Bacilli bacterium]|nr:metallophosphoesterase [Bacilli bacterium]